MIPRYRSLLRHPVFRLALAVLFVWDTLYILNIHTEQFASLHTPAPPPNTKRIYIAAQHWNDAELLRDRWNDALIALVKELGIQNVFVSIYESGSTDGTKDALKELDSALEDLRVERNIVLADLTHEDAINKAPEGLGWIKIPTGEMALRRIPFLADVRNQVLHTLETLVTKGHNFDTVLFLNDVLFTPEDVTRLLDTNGGNYAAACSLDFYNPPSFYDTFALRDSSGHEAITQTWPYFRSSTSRHAAQRHLPVPVTSCWNGMVAMPASPFLSANPIRFRGISDSLASQHVEGSECCLIHADNYYSRRDGVYLNPNVKVAYSGTVFDVVKAMPEMRVWDVWRGVWTNRLCRWTSSPVFKEYFVRVKVGAWARTHDLDEPGGFCLVNEMQVIHANGWRHV